MKHHRSQRPYQLPEGVSYYEHLQRLGLEFLSLTPRESRCFQESRMREIRTSGSTRGQQAAFGRLLSYSTGPKCFF